MPSIMNFVRRVCKKKIKTICCDDIETLHMYKQKILTKLRHNCFRHDPVANLKTKPTSVVCSPSEITVPQIQRKPFTYRTDVRIPTPISCRSSIDTNLLIEESRKAEANDDANDCSDFNIDAYKNEYKSEAVKKFISMEKDCANIS